MISKLYELSLLDISITLSYAKWEKDLALPSNPDFWIQINKNTFATTTYQIYNLYNINVSTEQQGKC